jgi:hypothetical protein
MSAANLAPQAKQMVMLIETGVLKAEGIRLRCTLSACVTPEKWLSSYEGCPLTIDDVGG